MRIVGVPARPHSPQILAYVWDEWGLQEDSTVKEPDLDLDLLAGISQRAVIGFTAASTEWLLARYEQLTDLTLAWQCLEAAWLQMIDPLYASAWDLDGDWAGPVRGPVRRAIDYLSVGVDEALKGENSAWGARHIARLVRYVWHPYDAFDAWAKAVLVRLSSTYPLIQEDELGEVVPPQAFDMAHDFDPSHTENEIKELLKAADYLNNPFLRLPEEMSRAGFPSIPYRFSLEDDARSRRQR